MSIVCVQRVSKALIIRHLRLKHAVHSLPVCDVFHNPDSNCYLLFFYGWTVRRLCVTGTNLGQRKHNEFRACALLVPSVIPQWHIHDAQSTPWVTKDRAVCRCAFMNFVRLWEEPASLKRIYNVLKINQVYKSASTQLFATALSRATQLTNTPCIASARHE